MGNYQGILRREGARSHLVAVLRLGKHKSKEAHSKAITIRQAGVEVSWTRAWQ